MMIYARVLVTDEAAAADLVQEAFVAAWKNLGKFDVTRDFATWMRGILRNKWRDHCRKVGRRCEVSDENLEVMEVELGDWEEQRVRNASPVFERLESCLKKLPEGLASAVKVFYYEALDGDEASEKLDVQPATFRKRLERARVALRECINNSEPHTA